MSGRLTQQSHDWTNADVPGDWRMKAVEDPGHIEGFGYIDFVKWLAMLDRTEAEVFLQSKVGGQTYTALGRHFGRDEFWAKRVVDRLTKRFVSETGLDLGDIEEMVREAQAL